MKKLSLVLLLGLFSCEKEKQPQIGEKRIYNLCFYFDKDPFLKGDTVVIVDIKNEYVQFLQKRSYGSTLESESFIRFNDHTRKIE